MLTLLSVSACLLKNFDDDDGDDDDDHHDDGDDHNDHVEEKYIYKHCFMFSLEY